MCFGNFSIFKGISEILEILGVFLLHIFVSYKIIQWHWVGLGWLCSYVILIQLNMTVELSNMSKKKRTIDCNKSEVKCDIGIVQCDNETIECEKKIREPPKVTKVQSHVILVLHKR